MTRAARLTTALAGAWIMAAISGSPHEGSASLLPERQDPTRDSTAAIRGALVAALAWGAEEMQQLHPSPTSVVLNRHAASLRAGTLDESAETVSFVRLQDQAEQAASALAMPVMHDATFDDRWSACSRDPHTASCTTHSGESSLEVWGILRHDDGSVEVPLNLRVIVGGRNVNWGVRNVVTLAIVERDRHWVVDRVVRRVSVTLLPRSGGS